MTACLLGIDSGLTVTKAVLFDLDGRALGIGRAQAPQLLPAPGHVERDMVTLWQATVSAIRDALADADSVLELRALFFTNADSDDTGYAIENDDYLQLQLSRYF